MATKKKRKKKKPLKGVERMFGRLPLHERRRTHGFVYKGGYENFNPRIHGVNPKYAKQRRKGIEDEETRANFVDDIMSIHESEDYDDYEKEELFNDFVIEDLGFDLDEFVDLMLAEGFSEHDAYELWFYP